MTDMECVHSNLIKLCVIHCSSPSVHKLARKFLATELSKYFSLKMYKNNVRSTNYASSSSALLLLCHSCLSICSLILTSSALKKFVIRLRSLSHLQKSVKFCWSAACDGSDLVLWPTCSSIFTCSSIVRCNQYLVAVALSFL